MKIDKIEGYFFDKVPMSIENKFILKRRVNKLKRDPKGFIESSYKKRKKQLQSRLSGKQQGYYEYTIISAVYNVERYLDDYFKSITRQSLDFKKHIKIILVDDGSTDNSAQIIGNWKKRYPNNIFYFYKPNGGQASARNLGIEHAKSEWITFIDPDDFIDSKYFEEIDSYLNENSSYDIELLCTNLIFYMEKSASFKDSHALNYKFKKGKRKFKFKKQDNNIQLSASSAIFKNSLVKCNEVFFNEKIRPTFEDAKFIADYLLYCNLDSYMAVIPEAKYLYRKRGDVSSTVDRAWITRDMYITVLERGVLKLLEDANSISGFVPKSKQILALYQIFWIVKVVVNNKEFLSFLSEEDKIRSVQILRDIFKLIDYESIMSFSVRGCWFYYKVGMIACFKESDIKNHLQIAYLSVEDPSNRKIKFTFYTKDKDDFRLDYKGTNIVPYYIKSIEHHFMNEVFVYENVVWFDLPIHIKFFDFYINKKLSRISFTGENHKTIFCDDIFNQELFDKDSIKKEVWLFIDRDLYAGDNAEHLYRYIRSQNSSNEECYFALKKESVDWIRLENEGFNLVDFGSKLYDDIFHISTKVISSQADDYIVRRFGSSTLDKKDFIFLQHGVIHNDLSKWLNTIDISMFVTSTVQEYESIVSFDSSYHFTPYEVKLTGLPRYDKLLKNNSPEKVIVIMPTWRNNIIGKSYDNSSVRKADSNFFSSEYAIRWQALLSNEKLRLLVKNYGYKIIFFPHINIQPYLHSFKIPKYINISTSKDVTMQELFQRAAFMITDYSSVAFDMAYLEKQVIYYQFDEKEFLSGSHTSKPSYFNYRKNGFGPVVNTEIDVLSEIKILIENGDKPLEPYLDNIKKTFLHKDMKNSQRVYNAIKKISRRKEIVPNVEQIISYAQRSVSNESWILAQELLKKASEHQDITKMQSDELELMKLEISHFEYRDNPVELAKSLWSSGYLIKALECLKGAKNSIIDEEFLRLQVKLAILNDNLVLARDSQKLLLERHDENCTVEDWQFYTQLASM